MATPVQQVRELANEIAEKAEAAEAAYAAANEAYARYVQAQGEVRTLTIQFNALALGIGQTANDAIGDAVGSSSPAN